MYEKSLVTVVGFQNGVSQGYRDFPIKLATAIAKSDADKIFPMEGVEFYFHDVDTKKPLEFNEEAGGFYSEMG
jgi:hypothetical protein